MTTVARRWSLTKIGLRAPWCRTLDPETSEIIEAPPADLSHPAEDRLHSGWTGRAFQNAPVRSLVVIAHPARGLSDEARAGREGSTAAVTSADTIIVTTIEAHKAAGQIGAVIYHVRTTLPDSPEIMA